MAYIVCQLMWFYLQGQVTSSLAWSHPHFNFELVEVQLAEIGAGKLISEPICISFETVWLWVELNQYNFNYH